MSGYKFEELLCMKHRGDDPGAEDERCPVCVLTEARDALAAVLRKFTWAKLPPAPLHPSLQDKPIHIMACPHELLEDAIAILDAHAPGWRER